jgi:isobutyryl-CoA mutase
METGYQRGKIQDESMLYEHRKHDGTLPIIGVNTFLPDNADGPDADPVELARATEDEKRSQLDRVRGLPAGPRATRASGQLAALQEAATTGGNVFDVLMDAVRHCSLGQITDALFEVGGQYRRNV